MKKLLALLLAVGILSMSAAGTVMADDDEPMFFQPGMEYPTETEDEEVVVNYVHSDGMVSYGDMSDMSKVGILGELGILGAYGDDGLFKPNVYVSRIEFVEALLKLFRIDYSDKPDVFGEFYDIDENSPYYNAVYTAYQAGIVSGYGDNNFRPDQVLSYGEAQTLAVKALGYNNVAPYNDNYAAAFTGLNLNKGVSVKNAAALTRLNIAEILYNVLLTETFQYTGLNKNGVVTMNVIGTPLYENYGVIKATGVMSANRVTGLDGNATFRKAAVIDGKTFTFEDNIVNSYIGCMVDYYYSEESEEIVYIHKNKKVEELVVKDKDIINLDYTTRKFSYKENNRRRVEDFRNAAIFYNGVLLAGNYSLDLFNITSGSVRLLKNNGNEVDAIFIESFDNYQISSVMSQDDVLTLTFGFEEKVMEINVQDTYVEVFGANGAYYEINKITDEGLEQIDTGVFAKNMIASIYVDNEGWVRHTTGKRTLNKPKYVKIKLSDKLESGKIVYQDTIEEWFEFEPVSEGEEAAENKIIFTSGSNYFSHPDSQIVINKDAEVYIDAAGDAVCLNRDSGEMKYGYLVRTWFNSEDELLDALKVLTTGGKVVKYNVEKPLRINNVRIKDGERQRQVLTASAKMVNPTFEFSQVIKYKLDESDEENPVITEIQTITAPTGIASGYDGKWLSRYTTRGTYYVDDDTEQRLKTSYKYAAFFKPKYVFNVPAIESPKDDTMYSLAQIKASGNFEADVYDVDALTPQVLVRYGSAATEDEVYTSGAHFYPMMFDSVNSIVNADNDILLEINVASGFSVKKLYSENLSVCDGLVKGDLVYFYSYNDKVIRCVPVKWTSGENAGKKINIDTLPDISSINNDQHSATMTGSAQTYGYMYELFGQIKSVNGSNFVVQFGPKQSDGSRQKLITGRFSHSAWMHGGVLLYDSNDGDPLIRQGTINDLRPADSYGDRASLILTMPVHGAGRQYVIYNLD